MISKNNTILSILQDF